MKTLLLFFNQKPTDHFGPSIVLANDADPATKSAPEWIKIPFGDHDHQRGMQKFDEAAGSEMMANFNAEKAERGKRFKGLPIYMGHPDHPVASERSDDKRARGWVREMRLANDGLEVKTDWNPLGKSEVEGEEVAYFSPVWGTLRIANSARDFKPVRLRSIGLTNDPNIEGVMPLTNEKQPKENPMNLPPWLLAMLGFAEDSTPTEDELKAKLNRMTAANEATGALGLLALSNAEALNDDQAQDKADFQAWMHELLGTDPATGEAGLKTALQDKVTKAGHVDKIKKTRDDLNKAYRKHDEARGALEQTLGNEKSARTTAETDLANEKAAREKIGIDFTNERTARIRLFVSGLIEKGRVLLADKDRVETDLANTAPDQLDAALTTLANRAPVLKTQGTLLTENLGNRKETGSANHAFVTLVNERMTQAKEDFETAWAKVKATGQGLALFNEMKQPASAK